MDLEFLLESDRALPGRELDERDQALFRDHIAPQAGGAERPLLANRSWVLRQWVEARRHGQEASLPGPMLAHAWRLLTKFGSVLLLCAGAGAAAQLLHYDGRQPVNVAAYFAWFVILQVALVLVALGVFWLRRTSFLAAERSLLTGLMGWAWTSLTRWLNRHLLERAPGERRQQLRAFFGTASSRSRPYRLLPVWPLAGLLQWLGICFNVGVLVTTLALVMFSDRAFGWQSAVDVTPEQVHAAIRALALPWSWLFPEGQGAPTLEQVEGSRIILKDGIRRLATANLAAWWPFLCLAVLTYGLVPRVLLLLLCRLQEGRALRRLSFRHVACDRLFERLTAPSVSSQGEGRERERQRLPNEPFQPGAPLPESTRTAPENGALLLLDPDLHANLDEATLRRALEDRFRLRIVACHPVGLNATELGPVLPELREWPWPQGEATLVVVQEAWEPPIAEMLGGLRLLRRTWGEEARLLLVLVGRAEPGHAPAPVRASDLRIWERETAALADPMLRVEPLTPHA